MRRIRDADDAQAPGAVGDIGIAADQRHAPRLARRIIKAGFDWMRRIGDVDDTQTRIVVGDVGIGSGHGDVTGYPGCLEQADLNRLG